MKIIRYPFYYIFLTPIWMFGLCSKQKTTNDQKSILSVKHIESLKDIDIEELQVNSSLVDRHTKDHITRNKLRSRRQVGQQTNIFFLYLFIIKIFWYGVFMIIAIIILD